MSFNARRENITEKRKVVATGKMGKISLSCLTLSLKVGTRKENLLQHFL
jgi:hypothetical protein